jgi:cephalosporin hydroxylase
MIEPESHHRASAGERSVAELPAFAASAWQMSTGERSALEGLLCQLKPRLAIEIGTAEGGSLSRIAAHSGEVHSFDLVEPQLPVAELDHVYIHGGDSHELLPAMLAELAEEGRNVDFVLVDGDHSSDGVRRDLEDLLDSPAVRETVIVIHDINNPTVRAGVDAVRYAAYPKVAHVELDCVPGYVFAMPSLRHELWGGLGLIRVDVQRHSYDGASPMQQLYYPAQPLLEEMRDLLVDREQQEAAASESGLEVDVDEIERLRHELGLALALAERHERTANGLIGSLSWRITRPLRRLKMVVQSIRR